MSLLDLKMDKLMVIVVQEFSKNITVMNNSVSYRRAFILTFVVAKQVSFLNCVIICTCYLFIWMQLNKNVGLDISKDIYKCKMSRAKYYGKD